MKLTKEKIIKLIHEAQASCLSKDSATDHLTGFIFVDRLKIATDNFCLMLSPCGYLSALDSRMVTPEFQEVVSSYEGMVRYKRVLITDPSYEQVEFGVHTLNLIKSVRYPRTDTYVYLTKDNAITMHPPTKDNYVKTLDAFYIKKLLKLIDKGFVCKVHQDTHEAHYANPAQFMLEAFDRDANRYEVTYIVMPVMCDLALKVDKDKGGQYQ